MKKRRNSKARVSEFLETPLAMASPPDDSPNLAFFTKTSSTNLASSSIDDLKRHIDRSHSEILMDFDASHSRLHKRFKSQTQACEQVMDEAEKDYKKVYQRIVESKEAMKGSYEEFMAEAQASASRACKTSITELSQSFEKALDALRVRFGISH
ncbi:Kinesin-like protein [Quillaja saponaria]|uniref:Kinesin-like protein n=1 Tax=Quillaja saponaria TaxID=32244 RepID=A0AAD7L878_QUISA|nr:Kinesin-like protein [Quillaja saponaria]